MKAILTRVLAVVLTFALLSVPANAQYFPDVTEEMTTPEFWADRAPIPDEVLTAPEQIVKMNAAAAETEDTGLVDLKSLPETFDGPERIAWLTAQMSERRDDYLGWTCDAAGNELSADFYNKIIESCRDPAVKKKMTVRYGVIVERTVLQCFPTDEPIYDDPEDPDFDYRCDTGLRVNEPVVVYTTTVDGRWYSVQSSCYAGWVRASDVALCADRAEWLSAWDYPAERTLVIWGDKVYTEDSNSAPDAANRMLTMGTMLELAETASGELVGNRGFWHNYAVWLPLRNKDGTYGKVKALIPEREKVSAGWLPLTSRNIAMVAFAALGSAYGWGGMLHADDCSGYIRSVYKCFGLELGRDADMQAAMPVERVDLSGLANEEKKTLLDVLPLGTTLYFPGHEMLYLGESDGNYYVINSLGSVLNPYDSESRARVRSIVVNTLDVRRVSGNRWLSELDCATVPYALPETISLPEPTSYREAAASGFVDLADGDFLPDTPATRLEAVVGLWRMFGKPESDAPIPFLDVDAEGEASDALRWAAENGVAQGTGDGKFEPVAPVTMQQLQVFFWRGARALGYDSVGSTSAAGWKEETAQAANWAREMELPIDSDGSPVTRAALVVTLQMLAMKLNGR